jgi:predicted acyl esterase
MFHRARQRGSVLGIGVIAVVKGHSIRLEASSSNFPRNERNLTTGGNNFDESEGVVARNTVHRSARYPSHLLLPVVPRSPEP